MARSLTSLAALGFAVCAGAAASSLPLWAALWAVPNLLVACASLQKCRDLDVADDAARRERALIEGGRR